VGAAKLILSLRGVRPARHLVFEEGKHDVNRKLATVKLQLRLDLT